MSTTSGAAPEQGAARGRGRPAIGAVVQVRIPDNLRARIAAVARGRREAETIRALLVEALDARER